MKPISVYLSDDHAHCDALFADAENAVADAEWGQAILHFEAFKTATLLHFQREEDLIFPEFESRTGMYAGPTEVMRAEHLHLRDNLAAMEQALAGKDARTFLGVAEGLLMLMRQHNMKEEQILYPMVDQALADDAAQLVESMRHLDTLTAAP